MKIFFYLLLTANVAYFMWEVRQGALNEAAVTDAINIDDNREAIVLVSELPQSRQVAVEQAPSAEPAMQCYLAGPFVNQSQYGQWLRNLGIDAAAVKTSSKSDLIIDGYIVYYPAAETPEQAKANLSMLKAHGIKDLWLFNAGDQKGEIALGTFKGEDKALLMQKEIQAKGVTAEVKPRLKPKMHYYLELTADARLVEAIKNLKAAYPQVDAERVEQCEKS